MAENDAAWYDPVIIEIDDDPDPEADPDPDPDPDYDEYEGEGGRGADVASVFKDGSTDTSFPPVTSHPSPEDKGENPRLPSSVGVGESTRSDTTGGKDMEEEGTSHTDTRNSVS